MLSSFHLLGIKRKYLSRGFLTKIVYAFLVFASLATCSAYYNFINKISYTEEGKPVRKNILNYQSQLSTNLILLAEKLANFIHYLSPFDHTQPTSNSCLRSIIHLSSHH